MSVIVKSFGKKTTQQVAEAGLTNGVIAWWKLLPHLSQLINQKENEVIEGIVCDETGISVKISYQPKKDEL